MTHELRTPITSIQSALEVVFTSASHEKFDCQLRFLDQVQHNTHVLNRLVEDLLILAKIDEGLEILRRPFSLHTEIERAIRKESKEIGERNLTVYNEIEGPLEVNGDTNQLRHLFYHLRNNAIKFSQPNQSIHIWAQTSEDGDLQLVFADQGIGIAPEDQEKIFDRFFQLDASDSRSWRPSR